MYSIMCLTLKPLGSVFVMDKFLKVRNHNFIFSLVLVALAISLPFVAAAHNPEKYAKSSVLSSGNWGRAEVSSSGMHFISNSALTSMGLNPATVNVYGYGGRCVPNKLAISEPDDLPLIPSVRTGSGLLFFAVDNVSWRAEESNSEMNYAHSTHPYSTTAYYYFSDRPLSDTESADAVSGDYSFVASAPAVNAFRQRLLHESELTPPYTSGRDFLGEDFRASSSQTFRFDLPGNRGDVKMRVRFGANISGGSATLSLTANGNKLSSSNADVVTAITTENQFLKTTSTVKTASGCGEKLTVGISCSLTGVVTTAALDFIEVEYDRPLDISAGYLYFYGRVNAQQSFLLSGCDNSTVIWDVTDPARPKAVNYSLEGSTAKFTVRETGLREFVAFKPAATGWLSPVKPAKVANQNLHALENPDMLIISPRRYLNSAGELADLHRRKDGMTVHVITPEEIYHEFSSGNPDVGAFRKILKMWGDRANADASLKYPSYCLILSKATYDNRRISSSIRALDYPIVPIWQSEGYFSEPTSYCTDDFVGMIDDSDNYFDMGSQKIRVAVGRLPVKGEDELASLVAKICEYVDNPEYGNWRNNVMLIADDQDYGKHLEQTESVYSEMVNNGNGADFAYEKLYLDSYPLVSTATGDTYPAAREKMLGKWNEGVAWINYIGHANPRAWSHEQLLTWRDINGFTNRRLPFLYAATCSFAKHDLVEPSGAEVLLLNPQGGIIGTICPSRTVYIPQNGTLSSLAGAAAFGRTAKGTPKRVGDVMTESKNNYPGIDENKLRFSLLGDPAISVPSPALNVVVDKIGDTEVSSLGSGDFPVIGARSRIKISGHIADISGAPATDFNGTLQAVLFDAERAITTFGNGEDGKVMYYNDRKTRLFNGAARVSNGQWEITVLMPAEIENNFSPALFSMYAWSDTGMEANGGCEQLYVYGYDTEAPEDTDGPVISGFALNNDSFRPGDATHPDPLVLATLSDVSGINISEAGVGHKMLLTLDNDKYFEDLCNFYKPDADSEGGGVIAYPLSGLEPGDHVLELTVWDNANNSSKASLPFRVSLNSSIQTIGLTTDANPAHDKVTFRMTTDRALSVMNYRIEVFDLGGHEVWTTGKQQKSRDDGSVSATWYLTDKNGTRVNRGLYLCRATVESSEGISSSKTIKLAVAAQ